MQYTREACITRQISSYKEKEGEVNEAGNIKPTVTQESIMPTSQNVAVHIGKEVAGPREGYRTRKSVSYGEGVT